MDKEFSYRPFFVDEKGFIFKADQLVFGIYNH